MEFEHVCFTCSHFVLVLGLMIDIIWKDVYGQLIRKRSFILIILMRYSYEFWKLDMPRKVATVFMWVCYLSRTNLTFHIMR